MRVLKKITENSERLDRQARQRTEPGFSRLPVLSAATGGAKDGQSDIHALPETFGAAAGFFNRLTAWSALLPKKFNAKHYANTCKIYVSTINEILLRFHLLIKRN